MTPWTCPICRHARQHPAHTAACSRALAARAAAEGPREPPKYRPVADKNLDYYLNMRRGWRN